MFSYVTWVLGLERQSYASKANALLPEPSSHSPENGQLVRTPLQPSLLQQYISTTHRPTELTILRSQWPVMSRKDLWDQHEKVWLAKAITLL